MIKFVAFKLTFIPIVSALVLLVVGCGGNKEQAQVERPQREALPVAIVSSGGLKSADLQRIADHVSWQFECEVIAEELDSTDADPKSLQDALADLTSSKASYAVGVLDSGSNDQNVVSLQNQYALVDVSPLKSGIDTASDHEVYLRRVERSVITALADMLNMEPCVIQQCVLFPVSDLNGLDQKGRGFCPPCQQRAKNLLSANGIKARAVASE